MGIQSDGMFGGFYGKTGPLIGRRVKGKSLVTALHHPSTKASTESQLVQQDKFTMLTQFLLKIKYLVAIGFRAPLSRGSALNRAYKFNYPHAFIEQVALPGEEVVDLNYPLLVYSRGHVSTPNCPSVAVSDGALPTARLVRFSWLPDAQSLYNRSTDKATFVVYNATTQRVTYEVDAAVRAALEYTLPLSGIFAGNLLYCYMSFVNVTAKLSGDSVCVGLVYG